MKLSNDTLHFFRYWSGRGIANAKAIRSYMDKENMPRIIGSICRVQDGQLVRVADVHNNRPPTYWV